MKWQIDSEQNIRIYNIIKDIPENDNAKALETWAYYLNQELKFPFEIKIKNSIPGSLIEEGAKLQVFSICMIDDLHGLIVEVRKESTKYAFELCLLKAVGDDEKTMQLVDDYSLWFCNK